jgi:RHS repeat-associated protein
VTRADYDAADNVIRQYLPENGNGVDRKLEYSYDPLGRTTQQTAPQGVATTSNPDDFVTRYTYDRVGHVLTVSTPFVDNGVAKNPTTTYSYDNVGNQIQVTDPEKTASSATDFTAQTAYDLDHRPTTVTDALGFTSKTEYDRDGNVVAQIDARGNRKAFDYDAAGQLIKVHVPQTPLGATQARDQVTQYHYDGVGNRTKVIRPSGKYSDTVYDADNRPVQKKGAVDPTLAHPQIPVTYLEYDKTGLPTRQSDPVGVTDDVLPSPDPRVWTTFSYFDSGEVKTSTDPWNITTSYQYNELGQQTSRTLKSADDPATRAKYWTYNPDGSLASFGDSPAAQPAVVADNGDVWQARTTGTWATVAGGTNTQGTDYRTHAAAAPGTAAAADTLTWDVTPDLDGSYELFASCPVRADASATATYTVNSASGSTAVVKNQQTCSTNPWMSLGTYTFTGGTTKSVVLKPSTVGVVSADAIKVVPKDSLQGHAFQHAYDLNGEETEVRDTGLNPKTDRFTTQYDGLGRPQLRQELLGATVQRQTQYSYDLNSNPLTTYAQQFAVGGLTAASRYTEYAFDLRNMVKSVKAGATPASTLDQWSFQYDPRGMRSKLFKPNSNVQASTYYEDGRLKTLTERVADSPTASVVADHKLTYSVDGELIRDDAKVDQPGSTNTIDQVSTYAYSPNQQLISATKAGASTERGDNESYVYDAAGNITQQTIGSSTSCMTYVKNRLTKTEVRSGTSCAATLVETRNHRYDAFGRATTVNVGGQVVERNGFDGFDRLVRQQSWTSAGVHQVTKQTSYDAFDRPSVSAEKVLTQSAFTSTRFLYLGTSPQVAVEEQTNTGGTYEVSKAYTYGPGGQKLSLVDTPVNGTTTKKFFYGTNPRGDTETLTDTAGKVTSTYRYTAFGTPDKNGTTGDDAITGDLTKDVDQVNPYRFNGSRYDGATGTYDMGFREYNPGLNRFLSRDMFNGALDDMALGTDPWNTNRYAFAGGNPLSRVELDGHYAVLNGEQVTENGTTGGTNPANATIADQTSGSGSTGSDAGSCACGRARPGGVSPAGEGTGSALSDIGNLLGGGASWLGNGAKDVATSPWHLVHGGGNYLEGAFKSPVCYFNHTGCADEKQQIDNGIQEAGPAGITLGTLALPGAEGSSFADNLLGRLLARFGGSSTAEAATDIAARRVSLRVGTKVQIREAAPKTATGDFIDPNTGQIIPREGPFQYGHKPGFEWWRTQQTARSEGWTRQELIEYENDWTHYQIEDPRSNMSHLYEMPR